MKKLIALLLLAGAVVALPSQAREIHVTITNLTHGMYFTPLLVAAHGQGQHLFMAGSKASPELQAMAEGGDISGLAAGLAGTDALVVENPAGGLLAPGASTTLELDVHPKQRYLSLVAMMLPTNDGFVGLDGLRIPKHHGTLVHYLTAYDAGTEANDEVINGGGMPGVAGIPADPGGNGGSGASGVIGSDVNQTVHVHRGIIGDTLQEGGISDLDSRVHRWLNPVARVTISVE